MNKTNFTLITGGASGIGFGIAKRLAENHHNLIILDKDRICLKEAEKQLSRKTSQIITVNIDLSFPKYINPFMRKLKRKNIIVKYLINNAGYQENINVLDISLKQWRKLFRVNLQSAFVISQKVAKDMIVHKVSGCIINITSIHSQIIRGIAHYSASKAGLEMLTKELAYKLAKHEIRVNAIAPGAIDTIMLRKDLNNSSLLQKAAKQIPLGRLGTTEDIAYLVEFLISDRARYITGSTITIDGGLSLTL